MPHHFFLSNEVSRHRTTLVRARRHACAFLNKTGVSIRKPTPQRKTQRITKMKKQTKLTIKARLFQGAFLLGIAFLFNDVTPLALGQDESSNQASTNARAQWVWQNPLPQGNGLFGLSFTDANNGTAVGWYGTILRTTDGGRHWIIQSSGTTNLLYGVSFVDANNGTVVGANGTILRTADG